MLKDLERLANSYLVAAKAASALSSAAGEAKCVEICDNCFYSTSKAKKLGAMERSTKRVYDDLFSGWRALSTAVCELGYKADRARQLLEYYEWCRACARRTSRDKALRTSA